MISLGGGHRLGWYVLLTVLVVTDRGLAQESVCARVRLEIAQPAVITRTAFRATLVINNETVDQSVEGAGVVIDIRDVNGAPANDSFGLHEPELVGIDSIDGAGLVPPESSASASWLIIPSHDAAPAEATFYDVGGELFYAQGGVELRVPLFPTRITVLPDPILEVKYFLQRDVFSDDPFTPAIEPIEPFSLGLMMSNHGAGRTGVVECRCAGQRVGLESCDVAVRGGGDVPHVDVPAGRGSRYFSCSCGTKRLDWQDKRAGRDGFYPPDGGGRSLNKWRAGAIRGACCFSPRPARLMITEV